MAAYSSLGSVQFSISNITDLVQSNTGNLDGLPPNGTVSTTPGRIIWAAGDHQGMIDPAGMGVTVPLRVMRLQLFMAGQDSWSVSIVEGTTSVEIASGNNEDKYFIEAPAFLIGGQKLVVTTTGAGTTSTKMVCTVVDGNYVSAAPRGV